MLWKFFKEHYNRIFNGKKEGQFHSKRGLLLMIGKKITVHCFFHRASFASVSCLSLGLIAMAGGGGKGQIAIEVMN